MFYCECQIAQEKMEELEGKVHGEGAKERIRVRFVEYDPAFLLSTKDGGLISLIYAYESMGK